MLSSMGYRIIPPVDGKVSPDADILIIMTCCVIESTERRMRKRILDLVSTGKQVYVGGCLSSISAGDLVERYPGLGILDTMGLRRLERSVHGMIGSHEMDRIEDQFQPMNRVDQIVPISTGCLGACTYCITRLARGSLESYDPSDITAKIREGISLGRNEILMTSQDTGVYGFDRPPGDRRNLGSLLRYILPEVEGKYRIRIGMMNPGKSLEIAEDLMDGMDDDRIFKFLHIPVQSGSDGVLKAMRRPYDLEDFLTLISRLRSRFPDLTLSTDIIAGFPGETENDFHESLELIRNVSPDILNLTRFSRRPGTEAYDMPGQVVGWKVKERSREITELQAGITRRRLEGRLGRHNSCLVTEVGSGETMMVRDSNYTPIIIDGSRDLLGKFIDADTGSIGPSYLIAGSDWSILPME